ncbi:MAG: radical SAM protein, partial [Chitinophagaceae bacterium]
AYLMYGFPTQTEQETIDSLEMVRQMFAAGVLQSAFWHLFTMTMHSPIGMQPEKFKVKKQSALVGAFANNDLVHVDETGADHEVFAFGLKKSLFNYMHGIGLTDPLQKWFEFKVPKTTIAPDYIQKILEQEMYTSPKPTARIVYLGKPPIAEHFTKSKKGSSWEMTSLTFQDKRAKFSISVPRAQGDWLVEMLKALSITNTKILTLQDVMDSYAAAGLDDFELLWDNKPVNTLHKVGLLKL